MDSFLHGVEVVEIDEGARPIRTVRSGVIGLIGTAPDADPDRFPLHTPVLIAGRRLETQGLGLRGTLPAAIDDIFDQVGAMVVMVRIPSDPLDQTQTVPSGIDDATGQYLGVLALLSAESIVKVVPRILIAPEFSQRLEVATELISVAERLRAVVIVDGPNTTDTEAITYREQFGSARVYLVDPWVRVVDHRSGVEITRPASARVAGLLAKSDDARGFWWSPSNQTINGIVGTSRSIDFALGDRNARANWLNEHEVTTLIQKEGFRLWGNRTTSSDPKWAFLSVRRTADMINESLLRAHLWAVDRNITRTYVDDVLEGVNAYLRHLRSLGAIINGQAYADPALNPPDQLAQGKITIDFDFTPPYPAEHIIFRSHVVNDYLSEVLPEING